MTAKLRTAILSAIMPTEIAIFFIEICSLWCDWWYITISVDNGLKLNLQQAIIYNSNDLFQQRKYATLGRDDFLW